jgi:DNA mismatch endonuclease, patch repair protein
VKRVQVAGRAYQIRVDAGTSARLSGIRQAGTTPERRVRAALSACGVRYRTSNRDLPGSPDLANRRRRWAIFVHGCYWHHHEGCKRATVPSRNRSFWKAKFRDNKARDVRVVAELEALGFSVVTIWECETTNTELLLARVRGLSKGEEG